MNFDDAVINYINEVNVFLKNHSRDLPYDYKVFKSEGKSYIRLIIANHDKETGVKFENSGSAYGFIVLNENDKKFEKGDLLKASSWKAPARNFKRGNVYGIDDLKINPYGV